MILVLFFLQRLSRLEEEEKKRVETRKRRFFSELLDLAREFQLQAQASLKRRKQRNDGVQVLHSTLLSAVVCLCSFILRVMMPSLFIRPTMRGKSSVQLGQRN